jgi:hypothetical protein
MRTPVIYIIERSVLVQMQSLAFTLKMNVLTPCGTGEFARCKENQIFVIAFLCI